MAIEHGWLQEGIEKIFKSITKNFLIKFRLYSDFI
nr:hypothetical protein SOV_4c06380 [Sporomusa ovata DSM 2662]